MLEKESMAEIKEEECRVSEDSTSPDGSRIAEEEGLLQGWKGSTHRVDSRPSKTRLLHWPWVLCLVVGTILIVLSGPLVGYHITMVEAEARGDWIQTNDYLLDSHWDHQSPPQRREFSWTIKDHVYNPDGVYRSMILVNNQFPGPLVEANEGDTIVVHVDNQAMNATSIHWHGIFQNGTPYMDGTVGVTQCPIAPGHKSTYEFTVADQTGTYWWHAHHGVQASDGLHGPLVIHSRKKRERRQLDYKTDRVVLISDHYHDLSSALLWQYLKPGMENAEPVPDGGLSTYIDE